MLSMEFLDAVRKVVREELDAHAMKLGGDHDLLTRVEAAALIRGGPSTINLWLSKGLLTRYGTKRKTLVSRRELLEAAKRVEDENLTAKEIEARALSIMRAS
ncbi:hypothetical protein VZQ01_06870 [Myxococcus faecalis]|uniref:hypothetical protein n=1 Tax=Myxococcus faecalis TaxID=3115646 RepID=UPI003CF5B86F